MRKLIFRTTRHLVAQFAGWLLAMAGTASMAVGMSSGAEPTFEDVTTSSGLAGAEESAWGDYDNDGDADVAIGGRLFRNNGQGAFSPAKNLSGSGVWGDFDNDGWLDFYSYTGQGTLYRNQRDGTFQQVAVPANSHAHTTSAAWGDANGDGCLDLFATNYEQDNRAFPDLIFRANGDGTFAEPARMPLESCWKGRGCNWSDFDDDGDLDLYVSNYRLMPNQLWVNDGTGRFEDQAVARGVAGTPDGPTVPQTEDFPAYLCHGHTIGSCWGDLNGDGHLDLVVVNFSHPPDWQDRPMVLMNCGPPDYTFRDANLGSAAGIQWQESYAKGALGDYDNDGDLDLYITTVYPGDNGTLFQNDGTGRFTDVGDASGTRGGNSYQVAWADYDNDGDLDLLTGGRLLRNRGSGNAWIKVKVLGGGRSNRAGIGARITLTAGDRTQTREVEGGNSGNQNDLIAHFGLGSHNGAVSVQVRFPSGHVGQWQAMPGETIRALEAVR